VNNLHRPCYNFIQITQQTKLSVELVEPCCSNMADDEEAVVLACSSLVFFVFCAYT